MNQQACNDLKVGDRVTWTHTSSNGNSWRFRTREGKVVGFEGGYVNVRYRGQTFFKERSSLRKDGEKTTLTEAFENFCGGPAHKEPSPAAASKEQQDRADEPTNSTRNEGPPRE